MRGKPEHQSQYELRSTSRDGARVGTAVSAADSAGDESLESLKKGPSDGRPTNKRYSDRNWGANWMHNDHGGVKRRRILFLSQCLPYPPFSGVTRRTYNIINQLSKEFDVRLLAFYRKNHQGDEKEVQQARDALSAIVEEILEPTPIPSEKTKWHFVHNHIRSVATGRAYTYYEYGSARFRRQLEKEIEDTRPDLVHVDSMDLYRWLDHLDGVATTCTHHSIESELLKLRGKRLENVVTRKYVQWQAERLRQVERIYAPRLAMNLMMSTLDAKRLTEVAPGSQTAVVHNGVNTEWFNIESSIPARSKEVVFLGPLYMYPNWDGIRFFVRKSWPVIRAADPEAILTLVGKATPSQAAELETVDGVQVLGFVPDIRPIIGRARCCIAPLRVGGGTRLKILEYWAMGKPVVSTAIGCEGLSASDGGNILIRDDPQAFAAAVIGLLSNADAADSLGLKARATVEAEYTWDRIGTNLRRLYHDLMSSVTSEEANA